MFRNENRNDEIKPHIVGLHKTSDSSRRFSSMATFIFNHDEVVSLTIKKHLGSESTENKPRQSGENSSDTC